MHRLVVSEQPSGCVTWSSGRVLQLPLNTVAKECRPEGQDWQHRQVSPTQSHQSNGAAEKASTRARSVANLDIGRRTAGDHVEEHTTTTPGTTATQIKARCHKKGEGKGKHVVWKRISLLKQPQQCRFLHKHQVHLENSRALRTWNRGSWV